MIWLALGALLDAALGEPKWIWSRVPHPAVMMGRLIGRLDASMNLGAQKRAKGVLAVVMLVVMAGVIGWMLALLGPVAEVIVVAVLLAQRSLVEHMRAVAEGLRNGLDEGRQAVAMIVGRDTKDMDTHAVARATIESGAENFSDGIVAPAFWFAVAGLPGLLIYKIVNTADSMVGYRTPRHEAFGWAAARLDDVLNLIPARLSVLLIAPPVRTGYDWRGIVADARLHRSPNAGWPEAAMARGLGVALAGPRSYDGQMRDLEWVNPQGRRDAGPADIDAACRRLWLAWAGGVALIALLAVV